MASRRDEMRALARLPNLDIAFIHRTGEEGEGEQIMLGLRAMPSFAAQPDLIEANPLLFWMRLSQAFYGAWLGYLTAAIRPPWLTRSM